MSFCRRQGPLLVNEGLYLVQVGLKPIRCFCLFFAKGQRSSIIDGISEVFPSLSCTFIGREGRASSTTLMNSFTFSGLRVIHVLIRCLPSFLAWCILLALKFTLQQTRECSVSQSALWYLRVNLTLPRLEHHMRARSSWCQCLDLGCLQDTLCWGFVMKKVLVIETLW